MSDTEPGGDTAMGEPRAGYAVGAEPNGSTFVAANGAQPALGATEAVSLLPSLERLEALARLEANWDSYDADPISATAIAKASQVIVGVDEVARRTGRGSEPPWMIAPVADGGIQIDWKTGTQRIEVLIDADGSLSYLIVDRSGEKPSYSEQHDVTLDVVRSLVDSILAE